MSPAQWGRLAFSNVRSLSPQLTIQSKGPKVLAEGVISNWTSRGPKQDSEIGKEFHLCLPKSFPSTTTWCNHLIPPNTHVHACMLKPQSGGWTIAVSCNTMETCSGTNSWVAVSKAPEEILGKVDKSCSTLYCCYCLSWPACSSVSQLLRRRPTLPIPLLHHKAMYGNNLSMVPIGLLSLIIFYISSKPVLGHISTFGVQLGVCQ